MELKQTVSRKHFNNVKYGTHKSFSMKMSTFTID